MKAATATLVGMADIQVMKGPAFYNCLGLGSCIGLVLFDRANDITGMVHVMLPEAFASKPVDKLGKFADTGIKELMNQMVALGADTKRLVVAYAGGAQVFKFGAGGNNRMDVGARNCEAVANELRRIGLKPLAFDVGGSNGRTMTVDSATGIVKVRTVVTGERVLCNIKDLKVEAA